jgi:GH15 family glucan-1,4-alpha-glucosidase
VTRPFRPHVLREYSLIADGQRGALIGPDGAIAWLCAPRWDSPATFSGLLGGQGRYAVTPSDPWNVWGGYYGLYTEEYDVHQRQLRGNLPQAFVHAAMLETAVRLSALS